MNTKEFGYFSENIARKYLVKKGYIIIDQNYRKPWGEIDLIAQLDDQLIFIEVKSNKNLHTGYEPERRVDFRKLNKIIRTATLYIEFERKCEAIEWQIDVIAILFHTERRTATITHYKNVASDLL